MIGMALGFSGGAAARNLDADGKQTNARVMQQRRREHQGDQGLA